MCSLGEFTAKNIEDDLTRLLAPSDPPAPLCQSYSCVLTTVLTYE